MEIIKFIQQPWPWYVGGPLIALTMFLLLYEGRKFGMSSNLRTICSIGGAGSLAEFFRFDWRSHTWNLVVVAGAIVGGIMGHVLLTPNTLIELNPDTILSLQELGFAQPGSQYLPPEIFSSESLLTFKGFSILAIAGFLVGFGTRYAGGCTSGHAISGLSNLQWPSLVATLGFFLGGLIMVHFILPLIF